MTDKTKRSITAVILAAFALITSLLNWWLRNEVFYTQAKETAEDAWRFLWMVPFVFGGLAARAWCWRKYPSSPWFSYLVKYPVWIISGCFFTFASFHSFLGLDSWLYYPTSWTGEGSCRTARPPSHPQGAGSRLSTRAHKYANIFMLVYENV